MPSPEATALTRRHRVEVAALAAAVRERILVLMRGVRVDAIEAWWESIEAEAVRLVSRGAATSADLADQYLKAHSRVEGVRALKPEKVRPNTEEIQTSLQVTGPTAFRINFARTHSNAAAKRAMQTQLLGAASRLTSNGSRLTVVRTFEANKSVEGWRRVSGGSPCAFCAMIISRGAVYSRKGAHFEAHDHDMCSAELLYRREPETAQAAKLRNEWNQVTAGLSPEEAVKAWRQAYTTRPSGLAVPTDTPAAA